MGILGDVWDGLVFVGVLAFFPQPRYHDILGSSKPSIIILVPDFCKLELLNP